MSKEVPKMTSAQVVEMEQALMAAYKKKEFQDALHQAWKEAKGDTMEQMKRRQELTLPIQIPIISKYGFEESKKGVAQSTAAVNNCPEQTEEMLQNHLTLMWLVDPDDQKARPDFVPDAEIPDEIKPVREKVSVEELLEKKRVWLVVGGQDKGGIVVRKGRSLYSPGYPFRLATGAKVVAESPLEGKRLHYRKLEGDGPDFGWISLVSADKEPRPHRGMLVVPEGVDLDDALYEELAAATFKAEKAQGPKSKFAPPDPMAVLALEN